jgi:hypothetical protein
MIFCWIPDTEIEINEKTAEDIQDKCISILFQAEEKKNLGF